METTAPDVLENLLFQKGIRVHYLLQICVVIEVLLQIAGRVYLFGGLKYLLYMDPYCLHTLLERYHLFWTGVAAPQLQTLVSIVDHH